MKDHWELFQNSQDPSKGVFYNCIAGWECAKINRIKLEVYGLKHYYNIVSPAAATALTAAMEDAQESRRPVFGYYWQPSPLVVAYEWRILEEPPYDPGCWEQIIGAVASPDSDPLERACAYENVPIEKLAHAGLQNKAPEVVDMLTAMVVGLEPLNRTMAWSKENDIKDWEQAAVYYLGTFEERWRGWVTPEAYDNVKDALIEAAAASP